MINIINPDLKIEYISEPYPIWIIDNFLLSSSLEKILSEWPNDNSLLWHHGHDTINGKPNLLEQKMLGISNIDIMPQYIGEVTQFFHSEEFATYIGSLLGIDNLLPDKAYRWSGMRTMLPNSFQLIHSDARKSPESGLRKELTLLLYLNKDYDRVRDEGCLEIWSDDMQTKVHEIEPLLNRMTVFLNSDTSYHGVPTVKSSRKAITFSILKQGEVGDRSKALFVKRPSDSEQIKELGFERSVISDKRK